MQVLPESWGPGSFVPDLPVSTPPFEEVHASWKQRIDQPYVYFERLGSYTETGALIATLQRELIVQGIRAAGPPFALYYDDPAMVPEDQLRSRIGIPNCGSRARPRSRSVMTCLPSVTVAYAFVAGEYPEVPRAYPGVVLHSWNA